MDPADHKQPGKFVLYLSNALKKQGNTVTALTNEKDFQNGEWKTADVILIGTRYPSEREWIDMKALHKNIIYICSTNPMVADIERYVVSINHNNIESVIRNCNGIWLKLTLGKYKSYLDALYSVPIRIIPNYWDNSLSLVNSKYEAKEASAPCDIVILEENNSFNTSCWKALVICEQLFLQTPSQIGQVFVFNTPDTNKTSMDMINSLTLTKKGKIRIFKSLPIKDIISFFLESKNNVAFLSNQIFDDVNYGYYDAIEAGFSVVHSSPVLKEKGCENYYDSNDISGAIVQLNNILKTKKRNRSIVL